MNARQQEALVTGFETASYWWTLMGTSAATSNLPDTHDEEVALKCRLFEYHASRREKLSVADMSAAAVARNDLIANAVLSSVRSWISDKLYTTVGYVGDLVGAAMAYKPNWARVARVDFGAEMKRTHFFLEQDVVMLNSSAFPCLARPVAQARKEWAERVQLDTVQWRFKAMSLQLSQATDKVCQKVRARPSDASLFASFADAMATALNSLSWMPSDCVLVVHHSEFASNVYPQIQHIASRHGVDVVIAHIDLLENSKKASDKFRKALRRLAPRVAIVPHILDDGQILPISQIVSDCASAGCISIVDGSLAVGNIDVNISSFNADIYIARLDTFCFCNPGTTVIVTNATRYNCLQTLTVSYFHGKGYAEEWRYYGHSDHSCWLCAIQALQFQRFICYNYEDYCRRMAGRAVKYLCEAWGVSQLRDNQHKEVTAVITVPLPPILGSSTTDAEAISQALERFKIYVSIIRFSQPDRSSLLACRVTCNVFNTSGDIQRLAAAVSAIVLLKRSAHLNGSSFV